MLEKEAHETVKGLFNILNEKCKLHHDETILTWQYCKVARHSDEFALHLLMDHINMEVTNHDLVWITFHVWVHFNNAPVDYLLGHCSLTKN